MDFSSCPTEEATPSSEEFPLRIRRLTICLLASRWPVIWDMVGILLMMEWLSLFDKMKDPLCCSQLPTVKTFTSVCESVHNYPEKLCCIHKVVTIEIAMVHWHQEGVCGMFWSVIVVLSPSLLSLFQVCPNNFWMTFIQMDPTTQPLVFDPTGIWTITHRQSLY